MAANPALELRDRLRSGEVTARETAEHFLARIAERDDLGAFITVTADQARADADAADALRAESARTGQPLPALHGLPIAHKDLVEVAGIPTSYGTAAFPPQPAEQDHPGVATLRAAGTVSLGKTQVPELGLNAYSENLIAPPARNPFGPERTPGGSSGGAAAAVAAGLLPIAPGSDGGGSVRIPSLACGLVGLKPGLGTIPSDIVEGVRDEFGAPRLTVSGPLAHTAADAAMLFDAMRAENTGTMRGAGTSAENPEPALTAVLRAEQLTGLRIGFSAASPFESAHPIPLAPAAIAAWEQAALRLVDYGHTVEAADIAYDPRYPEVFTTCWMAGLSLLQLPPGGEERLIPFTRVFRERALARSQEQHLAAARTLTEIAAGFRTQWGQYDVVLTPGLATAPLRIGEFLALSPDDDYKLQCQWTPFTSMVNVAGLPAIAVPISRDEAGFPVGVQLIGRAGSEEQLLQLAAQLTEV